MRYVYIIFTILVFSGCSFKTPPNHWQYKSINAFDAYTKDFLSNDDTMAKNDIKRAIAHAKQGADMTQLARIYLGKCALNISVGIEDSCKEYKNIQELVNSKELDTYYLFLHSKLKTQDTKLLPKRYQSFAKHINAKEFTEANEDAREMQKPTSLLLTSALLKKHIDKQTIDKAISTSSFYGYKKAVIFYLKKKREILTDIKAKTMIDRKISIITKE
jgi:hypothetical protein